MWCSVLNDSACDRELVKRLLTGVRGLRDEVLEDCVYDGCIPRRGSGMFVAGDGLECGIASLEV